MNTNKNNAIENEKNQFCFCIFLKTESEISNEKIEATNEFHWNDDYSRKNLFYLNKQEIIQNCFFINSQNIIWI